MTETPPIPSPAAEPSAAQPGAPSEAASPTIPAQVECVPVGQAWGRPYEVVYRDALPYGVVAGVVLPGDGSEVPAWALARLHPEEQQIAAELRGYRQGAFVGGRLACRAALEALGAPASPILMEGRGAPRPPAGVSVSISHKSHLAVAIVARVDLGQLGLDLEELGPARPHVARVVLTPAELEAVGRLPEDRRWIATLLRFSIKEAVYKAIAPRLQRYVGFDEAEVTIRVDGTASVQLQLSCGTAPPQVEARYTWLDGGVLSTVRARWSDS